MKEVFIIGIEFFWQYQPRILEDKSIKKSDIKALYMCGTEMFSNDKKSLTYWLKQNQQYLPKLVKTLTSLQSSIGEDIWNHL